MRVVKPLLAALLVVGLGAAWRHRTPVVAAYTDTDTTPVALQLDGLDLDRDLTRVGPSPYHLPVALDGRLRATSLSVAAPGEQSEEVSTMFGGRSRLAGVVRGPDGPIEGATVRIERHDHSGIAATNVVTGEGGLWDRDGLVGGRYRIRAWSGRELTMSRSEVLFVPEDSSRDLDLPLISVTPEPRATFTTRGDIYLGLSATVAVSLTSSSVNGDGFIEVAPLMGGTVSLASVAGFTVTPSVTTTDGNGVARFTVRCHELGTASTTMTYNEWRGTVGLPTCVPRPTPPPLPPGIGPDGQGASGGDDATGQERPDPAPSDATAPADGESVEEEPPPPEPQQQPVPLSKRLPQPTSAPDAGSVDVGIETEGGE